MRIVMNIFKFFSKNPKNKTNEVKKTSDIFDPKNDEEAIEILNARLGEFLNESVQFKRVLKGGVVRYEAQVKYRGYTFVVFEMSYDSFRCYLGSSDSSTELIISDIIYFYPSYKIVYSDLLQDNEYIQIHHDLSFEVVSDKKLLDLLIKRLKSIYSRDVSIVRTDVLEVSLVDSDNTSVIKVNFNPLRSETLIQYEGLMKDYIFTEIELRHGVDQRVAREILKSS